MRRECKNLNYDLSYVINMKVVKNLMTLCNWLAKLRPLLSQSTRIKTNRDFPALYADRFHLFRGFQRWSWLTQYLVSLCLIDKRNYFVFSLRHSIENYPIRITWTKQNHWRQLTIIVKHFHVIPGKNISFTKKPKPLHFTTEVISVRQTVSLSYIWPALSRNINAVISDL